MSNTKSYRVHKRRVAKAKKIVFDIVKCAVAIISILSSIILFLVSREIDAMLCLLVAIVILSGIAFCAILLNINDDRHKAETIRKKE